MKIFYLLSLIPLVVEGLSGSSKVVCSPSTVQAHLGQNVVLSCRVKPPFDLTLKALDWKHGPDVVHVYRSGGDNYDDQDLRFKNRTFLNHQNLKDGNVSLTLTKVTKKDEGTYTLCLRTKKPFKCSNVTLTVVSQTNNETDNQTGSALSSGDLNNPVLQGLRVLGVVAVAVAVAVAVVVAVVVVVRGILVFLHFWRNRKQN